MKQTIPKSLVAPGHPDYELTSKICAEIFRLSKGEDRFRNQMPMLLRQAIDEVVDSPRTGRRSIRELQDTEKTYIGTKIEILIRNFLGLPKGRLDLKIDDIEIDIKNTLRDTWMIPANILGQPCILVAEDEDDFRCFFGVVIAKSDYVTNSQNQDGKHSLSAEGFRHIHWLLNGDQYPANFWAKVDDAIAEHILDFEGASSNTRMARLFRELTLMPIPRSVVETVAAQLGDPLKRIRRNGGARDILEPEGIAVLSGRQDSKTISELGLPECSKTEFISLQASGDREREVLRRAGHKIS